MSNPDTSRRLPTRTILQDIESWQGLSAVKDYVTGRAEAMPEAIQRAYDDMQEKQHRETELIARAKAAADEAQLAEWKFHQSVLAMKESVRGHFGSDSNEAQSVGYKKKSERRRPRRRVA